MGECEWESESGRVGGGSVSGRVRVGEWEWESGRVGEWGSVSGRVGEWEWESGRV